MRNYDTPPWMIELANKAVEENLVDGGTKYKSAQGFACALSAIKLMEARRTEEKPKEDSAPYHDVFLNQLKMLFDFTKNISGEHKAAEAVIEWVAEKHGIVDISWFGISSDKHEQLISAVIAKFGGGYNENSSSD